MADYTYATVFIAAADQAAAQTDFPNYFNTACSPTGEPPATNYVTSGPFSNEELDFMMNEAAWPKKIYFGMDFQSALTKAGLQLVVEPNPPMENPSVDVTVQ